MYKNENIVCIVNISNPIKKRFQQKKIIYFI
jgi:hypothetical protein